MKKEPWPPVDAEETDEIDFSEFEEDEDLDLDDFEEDEDFDSDDFEEDEDLDSDDFEEDEDFDSDDFEEDEDLDDFEEDHDDSFHDELEARYPAIAEAQRSINQQTRVSEEDHHVIGQAINYDYSAFTDDMVKLTDTEMPSPFEEISFPTPAKAKFTQQEEASINPPLLSEHDVCVNLSCEIGKVNLSLAELNQLCIGSLIEFIKWPGKVKLLVNNIAFAEGYLVEVNGMLSVKITNKLTTVDLAPAELENNTGN